MICLDGLQITSQPEDFVGKVGDTVKFSITARGEDLTYQWQACGDGGSTWANAAACLTSRNFVAFIF